jgi:hypothetical protein
MIMRKVTKTMAEAFLARKTRTVGNTTTNGTDLLLHGNRIAWHTPEGAIEATMAGWGSVTTRERLNGVCQFLGKCSQFGQSKFEQYYGSRRISTVETIVLAEPGWVADPPSWYR